MKTIDEDIKNGQFRTCYLLYGEETYLKRQYRDKLTAALAVKGDTMNFSSYEGKGISAGELVDLAETMPFFADRRVILVEDSGFFKSSCELLADYLPKANAHTCFVFVESEVDKRSKTYKSVKKPALQLNLQRRMKRSLRNGSLEGLGRRRKKLKKLFYSFF